MGNGQDKSTYQFFVHPPMEARPRVWWHWMDGNVTKDGVYKDLMWMRRIGLGGLHHLDAGMHTRQIVDKRLVYMDAGWKNVFKYSIDLLDSMNMEMGVASAPGWSSTGGPWVEPKDAMKKLTWREMTIKGGKEISVKLPAAYETTGTFQNIPLKDTNPKDKFYQDIVVLAVRLNAADKSMQEMGAEVTSSGGNFTVDQLTDGDLTNSVGLPCNEQSGYAWIQYQFNTPQTIKALRVVDNRLRNEWFCMSAPVMKHVEASNDGVLFRRICDVPHGGAWSQTISIPETTAKYFRIIFDNPVVEDFYAALNGAKAAKETMISELVLYPVTKINHIEEKAGYASPHDMMMNITPEDVNVSHLEDVIDVTKFVKADGTLTWKVPKGDWKIYRFGCSLTGKRNHPAPPEATGLEVDKLDYDAVHKYMDTFLEMYRKASGGKMGAHGLTSFLIDSYEAGWETWTEKMRQEFSKRRGYDLVRWLPVLTGQIIESSEKSEQFLWDWRKTIGDLISENLYGQIADIVKDNGMQSYFESHENGRIYLADGMEVKKKASIPMAAIWARSGAGGANHMMSQCDIRESASTAHIYGQNIVAGETFTSDGFDNRAYSYYPGNLKWVADLAMSCGLNRFFFHDSASQPVDDKKPGLGLAIYGHWFNRHETWAEQAGSWVDYIARSSYMLQKGTFMADILYYYGEDNCITGLFALEHPKIPNDYNFDYINADALKNMISCKDQKLVTASGMKYRLLFLDKNAKKMSLPVLRKIAELVRQGAVISGQKPECEPTMTGDKAEFKRLVDEIWDGKHHNVLTTMSVSEALDMMNLVPDFTCEDMADMRYVHRSAKEGEIYWVSNAREATRSINAVFRISGLKPQVWHPETGKKKDVSYIIKDGKTIVPLDLAEYESVFVVFGEKTDVESYQVPRQEKVATFTVNTPWTVDFGEQMGVHGKVIYDQLASYTESDNKAIKYFSGTAIYTNTIKLPKLKGKTDKLVLDLGMVNNVAEVFVNGVNVGTLWKYPYQVDITSTAKRGSNTIEIRVTNLWVNRLIGDAQPDAEEKYTYTVYPFYKANSPLQPSGLLGPVNVYAFKEQKQSE